MSEITNGAGAALASDLIWGARAIAAEIDRTERQTLHLIESKRLPVGKIGGRIVASRTALREFFARKLGGLGQ